MGVKCNNCGTIVPDTTNFCTECGTKIDRCETKSVCIHCGAELREGANFCVECGTKIVKQEPQIEEVSNVIMNQTEGDELFTKNIVNLRRALLESLEQQRKNPNEVAGITTAEYKLFDDELTGYDDFFKTKESRMLSHIVGGFSNCCFMPDTGDEVYLNTLNDGKPHLMFDLLFFENDEPQFIEKLIASTIYNRFTHVKVEFGKRDMSTRHHFYVDFKEDVDAMINLCKVLIKDIFAVSFSYEYPWEAFCWDEKKNTQKNAIKTAKYQVKNLKLKSRVIQKMSH